MDNIQTEFWIGPNYEGQNLAHNNLPLNEDDLFDKTSADEFPPLERRTQAKGIIHLDTGQKQTQVEPDEIDQNRSKSEQPAGKHANHPFNLYKPKNPDMILQKHEVSLDNFCLNLESTDYHVDGCDHCLLGIFAGRFPGKESVHNLLKRWPNKPTVSFHNSGWMIFQFKSDEELELIRQKGPYSIFGIPLILQLLPPFFRFNETPICNFPVWVSLPNLPIELWTNRALGKIASCIGEPIAIDEYSMNNDAVDKVRLQVLIDASKPLIDELMVRVHNGEVFAQSIVYEFKPKLCSKCRRFGHLSDTCNSAKNTSYGAANNGPISNRDRGKFQQNYAGHRAANKGPIPNGDRGRVQQTFAGNRNRSKSRPKSRGHTSRDQNNARRNQSRNGRPTHGTEFIPVRNNNVAQSEPILAAVNTHIHFNSPSTATPLADPMNSPSMVPIPNGEEATSSNQVRDASPSHVSQSLDTQQNDQGTNMGTPINQASAKEIPGKRVESSLSESEVNSYTLGSKDTVDSNAYVSDSRQGAPDLEGTRVPCPSFTNHATVAVASLSCDTDNDGDQIEGTGKVQGPQEKQYITGSKSHDVASGATKYDNIARNKRNKKQSPAKNAGRQQGNNKGKNRTK